MVDKYVVFIPVRGGSKEIPLKNIKEIAGRPLVYWALDAAFNSTNVDKIYVSTDSYKIAECIKGYKGSHNDDKKIHIINRKPELCFDTTSTDDVLVDFAQNFSFENLILMQATNPLVTTEDINEAMLLFPFYDSVVSTVVQKRFYWLKQKDKSITELGHNIKKRPRRQDFDGVLVENGSIYMISREKLLANKCRLCGKIGAYIMSEESYFEIDSLLDFFIVEQILKKRTNQMDNKNE